MTPEEKKILIEKFENDKKKRSQIMRFLLSVDQMGNVLLWNGSQDETISSHVGRRIEGGKANWLDKGVCKFLRWLESKHCFKSKGE